MADMNNNYSQRGFGLIEVIIGITMLILTATAALSLSRTSIKAEAFNSRRVVAYNLGQQILEEARRTRDSAWDDLNPETRWLIGSEALIESLENYEGSQNFCEDSDEPDYAVKCTVDNIPYHIAMEVENVDMTELQGDEAGQYTPASLRPGVDISEDLAKRIFVDVKWDEAGSERHLELITLLTDWKPAI